MPPLAINHQSPLADNNPQFPREPSATILICRLAGTAEVSASNRDEHPIMPTAYSGEQSNAKDRDPRRNLREPHKHHRS